MARVVLAMSGGVDSSVAAHLLRAEGHEVIGLFMRHSEPAATCAVDLASSASGASGTASSGIGPGSYQLPIVTARPERKQGCCSASDAEDARRVADRLGITFYALDFTDAFGQIMDYFAEEYLAGRTPNPCVMCNNWLKFGKLCDYADSVGADLIATGHYAQLDHDPASDRWMMRRGLDAGKDQSYVLFGIDRQVLPRIRLPVGGYQKAEIREIAYQIGLRVAGKPDSQEICFVPDGDYAAFVKRRGGAVDLAGEIVTVEGEVVGNHQGLEHYTIGQRKGLGVAFREPRYVVRLETQSKRVVIGTREQLARQTFTFAQANWLVETPQAPFDCEVQIRYNSRSTPGRVTPLGEGRFQVELYDPRTGVAPGQAAVCYSEDQVLGGGWIE